MHLLAQSTSTYDSHSGAAAAAAALMGGTFLIVWLVLLVAGLIISYIIVSKTGYSGWLALLQLIPFIGPIILVIMLAFTEWPIQRELRALRAQLGGGYGGGGYGGGYGGGGGYTPPPPTPPSSTLPSGGTAPANP